MNHYHFITKWQVKGDIRLAYELLNDPVGYLNWWRNVPLRIQEIKPADASGLNQIVRFEMRAPLFYILRWELKGIESKKPYRFASEASGDFLVVKIQTVGRCVLLQTLESLLRV